MGLAHSGVQYRFTANSNISAGNVVMLQTSGINANVVHVGLYTNAANFPKSEYNNLSNTSFGGNLLGSDGVMDSLHTNNNKISYPSASTTITILACNDYNGSGDAIGGKIIIYGTATDGNATSTTAITGTDTGDKFYNVTLTGRTWNYNANNYYQFSIYYTKYDASSSTASNHYRYFSVNPADATIAMTPEVDISSFGLPTTVNSWTMHSFQDFGLNSYKFLAYYSDPDNNNYGTIKNIWASDFTIDDSPSNNNSFPNSYIATTTNWTIGNAHVVNSYDISSSYQHKTLRANPFFISTSAIKFLTCSSTHITAGVYNDTTDTVSVGTATTPTTNVSHNVSMLSADWDTDFTTNKVLTVYDTGANNGNNYVSARVGYYHSGNNQITFSNTTQYASTTQGGSSGSSNVTCLTYNAVGSMDSGNVHIDNGVTSGQFWSVKQHKSSGTSNLIYMAIDVASNNQITFAETSTGVETHSFDMKSGLFGQNYVGYIGNNQLLAVNYSNPGLDFRRGDSKIKYSNIDSDNIIGVAPETVAVGEQITIDLPMSVSSAYSGLTIGSQYYVDGSGRVTANQTSTGINSNHYIGKALGTDAIFLNGDIFGRANTLDTVKTPE
jgi:hypothetical protein